MNMKNNSEREVYACQDFVPTPTKLLTQTAKQDGGEPFSRKETAASSVVSSQITGSLDD